MSEAIEVRLALRWSSKFSRARRYEVIDVKTDERIGTVESDESGRSWSYSPEQNVGSVITGGSFFWQSRKVAVQELIEYVDRVSR